MKKINHKTNLMGFENVHNIVFRDNGYLEVYYKKESPKYNVLKYINMKCLNYCLLNIHFIKI